MGEHMAKSVVTFGELLLRLDTRGYERFVQSDGFVARYTGGEANVAAELAQWGVETFAVSKVPDHEIGQACVNYLQRFNINTDWVLRGPGRLGVLYVETGASQRPSKVVYDRDHTCFRGIQRGELDWDAILRGKDWFLCKWWIVLAAEMPLPAASSIVCSSDCHAGR